MKKNNKWKKLKILIRLIVLLFLLILIFQNDSKNILFLIGNSVQNKKYWVGGKYVIFRKKYQDNKDEKIYLKSLNNKTIELSNGLILMKSSGRECFFAYTKNKKIKAKICINIYHTPELSFKETNPIKLEIYNSMKLLLDRRDYPKINIKFKSNHPEIIKVNNEGEIIAVRPGRAIITASALDGKRTHIKILAISNNLILKFLQFQIMDL